MIKEDFNEWMRVERSAILWKEYKQNKYKAVKWYKTLGEFLKCWKNKYIGCTGLFTFLKYVFYYQCFSCMYVYLPEEGMRPHYRWLCVAMWLLRIELRTSRKSGSALYHWATSSTLGWSSLKELRSRCEIVRQTK